MSAGRYTVAVDHGSGRIVWAREGRDEKIPAAVFDEWGSERIAMLTHADPAAWIGDVVRSTGPTWARRSRIPASVELTARIRRHQEASRSLLR